MVTGTPLTTMHNTLGRYLSGKAVTVRAGAVGGELMPGAMRGCLIVLAVVTAAMLALVLADWVR
jgi:type IV secretory pathway TrbD component